MNFRETLKHGTMVATKRKLIFFKKHDTHVTESFPRATPLMIWGFERFSEEVDPTTEVEIEFLYGSDLWCLAIPKGDFIANYLDFGENENA